ncbi:MAG: GNAT family N-acetyltransferase, partial [Ornithinimicrobium sp.]
MDNIQVRPFDSSDRVAWGRLYRSYALAGGVRADGEQVDRVCNWILSASRATFCYVATAGPTAQELEHVGFVHWRPFEIPILGTEALYIDDLFVDPAHRGKGTAARLI